MAERVARTLTCEEADDMAAGFVLGALTPDEMDDVRQHLAGCANEHAEFDRLGAVTAALLESVVPLDPRPELGESIMAAAREERAGRIGAAWRAPRRVAEPAPVPQRDVVTAHRPPLAWIALAAAAAIVLAALGAWNLQLRGQVDELAGYRDAVAGVVERAAGGGQLAILVRQGAFGGLSRPRPGIAAVGTDGSVAVAMPDLTPTTGTEVYTVWLIGADQTPLPVGDFTVAAGGAGGTVTLTGSAEDGVTIALTREPRPGMTAPTLPIVALGTAQPAGS